MQIFARCPANQPSSWGGSEYWQVCGTRIGQSESKDVLRMKPFRTSTRRRFDA
jgi:hypothetical protein